MAFHLYFKLFNTIKDEHEAEDLARLELESLFGEVRPISNFISEAAKPPLSLAIGAEFRGRGSYLVRLEDILLHELPYGRIHGFYGKTDRVPEIGKLVRRLAYSREIVVLAEGPHSSTELDEIYPEGAIGINCQMTQVGKERLFRFITNQYFLEKSEYISKLSRNEKEVIRNVDTLFHFLTSDFYRIPATETMKIGKRLEDYFAVREESSLYLTHYMHPYKGKFHPKMARALLNYVFPKEEGTVMDNFAGSGTLLVEACLMGLDAIGVEINPLSVLMSNVKCQCLAIPLQELKAAVDHYVLQVSEACSQYETVTRGQAVFDPVMDFSTVDLIVQDVPSRIANGFRDSKNTLAKIVIANALLGRSTEGPIRDFLQLALSGSISDSYRRTKADFIEVLQNRLHDLYLRVFLFHELNKVLRIPLGRGSCLLGDTRDMREIKSASIDAIVNSPPYSTALDYIRNDEPQLRLLGLADDLDKLEDNMMGNPRHDVKLKESLAALMDGKRASRLPPHAVNIVVALGKAGRLDAGLRCLRFFEDMEKALEEMLRVLRPGAMAAVVIGNNHFLVNGEPVEVKNDDVLRRLAQTIGFEFVTSVKRELEKSSTGMIRYESVLFLRKPNKS